MKSLLTATSKELPLRLVALLRSPILTAPLDCTSICACNTWALAKQQMLTKQMDLKIFFMILVFKVTVLFCFDKTSLGSIFFFHSKVIKILCIEHNTLNKYFGNVLKKFQEC